MKTAIIFVTHIINDNIREQIIKLYEETKNFATLYIVHQSNLLQLHEKFNENILCFSFSIEELQDLGYKTIGSTLMEGNFHLVLLNFYLKNYLYDYYWFIEYDVRFNGNWSTFFQTFITAKVDFISAHIEEFEDNPDWYYWNSIYLNHLSLTKDDLVKSFNPICGFSNRSLRLLNERCVMGDFGHNEILIPTIFKYYKLSILDFGVQGKYTNQTTRNLFYVDDFAANKTINGTHRFRPEINQSEIERFNTIYHPIKCNEINYRCKHHRPH